MRIPEQRQRAAVKLGACVILSWALWSCFCAPRATQEGFDGILVGETRSAVEAEMGHPAGSSGPGLPGEDCVYWLMPGDALQGESNWMVCFRDGRVTRKETNY